MTRLRPNSYVHDKKVKQIVQDGVVSSASLEQTNSCLVTFGTF